MIGSRSDFNFFYSMASYKYGRSILLGKRVTHWGQKTLPFLLREVILKKWFCKCYRVTVNFISTTVVEKLACYHEPSPTYLAREETFGIVIIFDWIVHNKQNLVNCIFLTFFSIFWPKNKQQNIAGRTKKSLLNFSSDCQFWWVKLVFLALCDRHTLVS